MKICRYEFENNQSYGIIRDGFIEPLHGFPDVEKIEENLIQTEALKLDEVSILPSVEPSKIVCVGRNYAAHAKELGNEVPTEPLLFLKAPSTIIGNGAAIQIPLQSEQVEHEGELGIVIGKTCRALSEDVDPLKYVLGFICLNDVTARDIQRRDVQFTRGKSFDTFCPVSDFIETDLDVSDISVKTKVNGVVRQDGRTSQMVFTVPFLIRYISNQMTLNCGDIIATGTPSGVSVLNDGDICEIEIEGLDILRNPVIGKERI